MFYDTFGNTGDIKEIKSVCPKSQSHLRFDWRLHSLSLQDGIQCSLDNFLYIEVMGTLKEQLPKDDLSRDGEMESWHVSKIFISFEMNSFTKMGKWMMSMSVTIYRTHLVREFGNWKDLGGHVVTSYTAQNLFAATVKEFQKIQSLQKP